MLLVLNGVEDDDAILTAEDTGYNAQISQRSSDRVCRVSMPGSQPDSEVTAPDRQTARTRVGAVLARVRYSNLGLHSVILQ